MRARTLMLCRVLSDHLLGTWAVMLLCLMCFAQPAISASGIPRVSKLILQSEKRISRTVFEYVFKVEIDNMTGDTIDDLEFNVGRTGSGTSVVEGNIRISRLPARSKFVPDDSVTLRHDRLFRFLPDNLGWSYVLKSTLVELDTALPRYVFSTVSKVISPVGEGIAGERIATPGTPESIVMGLDPEGRVFLGSMEIGPTTTLSAESTAIVFSRMAFGPIPAWMTGAEFNATLRSAEDFETLVSDIATAIAAGSIPLESPVVHRSISKVLSQIRDRLPDSTTPDVSTLAAHAMTLERSVTTPLPYPLLKETSRVGVLTLAVTELLADTEEVKIKNEWPIAWSIQVEGKAPQTISGNGLADVLLGRVPILNWVWNPSTLRVFSGGKSFNLIVGQTIDSLDETATDIVSRSLKVGLTLFPPNNEKCVNTFVKTSLSPAVKNTVELTKNKNLSADYFWDTLWNEFRYSNLIFNSSDFVKHCLFPDSADGPGAEEITKRKAALGVLSSTTFRILRGLSHVGDVENAASLAYAVYLFDKYMNVPDEQVAVCIGWKRGIFLDSKVIANCPARFEFAYTALYAEPGANVPVPEPLAYDSGGIGTAIPVVLAISIDKDAQLVQQLEISTDSKKLFVKHGLLLNPLPITVLDPFTDAKGQFTIQVVKPELVPSSPTLAVGGFGNAHVKFRNEVLGLTFFTTSAGIQWVSSNSNILQVTAPAGTDFTTYEGKSTGIASVARKNLLASSSTLFDAVTSITVNPPPNHWSGTYTITSCTQKPGSQWYWIDPCKAYLPIAGDSGRFFFSDVSDSVAFESSFSGRSVRGMLPLRWRSTQSEFEFATPTQRLTSGYVCNPASGLTSLIQESGEMLYSFTVLTRSATTIGGTFSATMKSGYLTRSLLDGGFCVEDWRTIPASASGTWTATLQQTGMPMPQLNGFDYCTDSNVAVRGCAAYGTDDTSSCATAAGACRFQ